VRKWQEVQEQFYRLKARRGPEKAIMAVVAPILTAVYHMLKDGTIIRTLAAHFKCHTTTDQQKKRAWSSACQILALR
jgi:transposase